MILALLLALDDKDLFPLKPGSKWIYDASGTVVTATVDGTAKVGDKDCTVVKREWDGGSSREYYTVTEDGVFLHRLEADKNVEFANDPVPRLKFGVKKGDTWTWKFEGQEGKYEHQGEEEIEIAAGKFQAVKIHVTATSGDMSYTVTRWYAPGVGLVKEEMVRDASKRVTELKKFEAGK